MYRYFPFLFDFYFSRVVVQFTGHQRKEEDAACGKRQDSISKALFGNQRTVLRRVVQGSTVSGIAPGQKNGTNV